MIFLVTAFFMLLQDSATSVAEVREGDTSTLQNPKNGSGAGQSQSEVEFNIQDISPEALNRRDTNDPLIPIPRSVLQKLISGDSPDSAGTSAAGLRSILLNSASGKNPLQPNLEAGVTNQKVPPASESENGRFRVRSARYTAVLQGPFLRQGTVDLELFPPADEDADQALPLGVTTLQELAVSDGTGLIAAGSDSRRQLFLLKSGLTGPLRGTWSAEGIVTGESVTFRMDLPRSVLSRFDLLTSKDILVSSSNGFVLDPELQGEQLRWTILPAMASRLAFTCRTRPRVPAQTPVAVRSLTAEHRLQNDTLFSRWMINPPESSETCRALIFRVPTSAQITEVRINAAVSSDWQVEHAASQSMLRINLPRNQNVSLLTIAAETNLTDPQKWSLPLFTPESWQSESGDAAGPLAFPGARINVQIPSGTDISQLSLRGIQERDIIAGEGGNRICQLTQYQPDASADFRLSAAEPIIRESLVTVLETTGRIPRARCFLNVECREAPAFRLQWSVAGDWDVISARFVAGSRALFFEQTVPDDVKGIRELTVMLPEVLEPSPAAPKVIELIFQRSDLSSGKITSLPLLERSASKADDEIVVLSESFQNSVDRTFVAEAGSLARELSVVQNSYPWLPKTAVSEDDLILAAVDADRLITERSSTGAGLTPTNVSEEGQETPGSRPVFVNYSARIRTSDQQIQELTEIVLPTSLSSTRPLTFITPKIDGGSVSWIVNGLPVEPAESSAISIQDESGRPLSWSRITLPELPGAYQAGEIRVLCECIRRQASPLGAAVVFPDRPGEYRGTVTLTGDQGQRLTADNLSETTPRERVARQSDSAVLRYELPTRPQEIRLRTEVVDAEHLAQTVSLQVFHHIGEDSNGLLHQVMAVADVENPAGNPVLLQIPKNAAPTVAVDGHRVHVSRQANQIAVPMPVGRQRSQLIVIWSEQLPVSSAFGWADVSSDIFSDSLLPERNAMSPDHGSLPDDLTIPAGAITHYLTLTPAWTFSNADILWHRRMSPKVADFGGSGIRIEHQPVGVSGINPDDGVSRPLPEVRAFLSQWAVSGAQNWPFHTIAVSASTRAGTERNGAKSESTGNEPSATSVESLPNQLRMHVYSTRFLKLMQSAVMLLALLVGLIVFPSSVRFRRFFLPLCLLATILRVFPVSAMMNAVLSGGAWGIVILSVLSLRNARSSFTPAAPKIDQPAVLSGVSTILIMILNLGAAAVMSSAAAVGAQNEPSSRVAPPSVDSQTTTPTAPQKSSSPQPEELKGGTTPSQSTDGTVKEPRTNASELTENASIFRVRGDSAEGTPDDLLYIRKSLLRSIQDRQRRATTKISPAIVTSSAINISVIASDAVEVVLMMDVATIDSHAASQLPIPLMDAKLVECHVDGVAVLPSSMPSETAAAGIANSTADRNPSDALPDGTSGTVSGTSGRQQPASGRTILIPLSSLRQITPQNLQSVEDDQAEQSDPAQPQSSLTPGPPVLWNIRRVECRLRPMIAPEPGGLRFRIPSLPSHISTVTMETPSGFVRRAVIQGGSVVRDWVPEDGQRPVSGIDTSAGISIRVYSSHTTEETVSAPRTESLTLCETISGLQHLTTTCRIDGWNPLIHHLRSQIPSGYRLNSVTCDSVPDVAWSVQGGVADIRIARAEDDMADRPIVLQFRMQADVPTPLLKSVIPVSSLGRLDGCEHVPVMRVAIRTTPEFVVQQQTSDGRNPTTYSEIPDLFRSSILRTDVVYEVPSDLKEAVFPLTPREADSEARIIQSLTCDERLIEWNYEADIETSGLPLFRHRLLIAPSLEITELRAFSGEADRLEKYYRLGEQVFVVLREGTIGPHRILIRGRQLLSDSDREFRLASPRLQNVDVLESSLTITDRSPSGFMIGQTGGTRPDRPLPENGILPVGEALRFQVLDESDPLVMKRRRSTERMGEVAVVRKTNSADGQSEDFLMTVRIPDFSTETEACEIRFPGNTVFSVSPQIAFGDLQFSAIQSRGETSAGGGVSESVPATGDASSTPPIADLPQLWTWPFENTDASDSDLLIFWSVPGKTDPVSESGGKETTPLALPKFSFDVKWQSAVVYDSSGTADGGTLPAWVSRVLEDRGEMRSEHVSPPVTALIARPQADVPGNSDSNRFETLQIPLDNSVSRETQSDGNAPDNDSGSPNFQRPMMSAVADTVVHVRPGESVFAETTLVILRPISSSGAGSIELTIPAEISLLTFDISPGINRQWLSSDRVRLELRNAVTTVSATWIQQRPRSAWWWEKTFFQYPEPVDCRLSQVVTVRQEGSGAMFLAPAGETLTVSETDARLRMLLDEVCRMPGFRSEKENSQTGMPEVESLLTTISAGRHQPAVRDAISDVRVITLHRSHESSETLSISTRHTIRIQTVLPVFILMSLTGMLWLGNFYRKRIAPKRSSSGISTEVERSRRSASGSSGTPKNDSENRQRSGEKQAGSSVRSGILPGKKIETTGSENRTGKALQAPAGAIAPPDVRATQVGIHDELFRDEGSGFTLNSDVIS